MDEIKPLTSLRGIAALAVVLQHFSTSAQTLTPSWIPSLVPHGYMAVDFFFVLSGFIMCLTYSPDFRANGMGAFPAFIVKRIARIVPLNVFVVTMVAAAGLASRAWLGENIFFDDTRFCFDLVANLLMLHGLGIGENMNGPSWSVSTEFAAYFLFPLMFWLMFGARRWIAVATLAIAVGWLCEFATRMPRLRLGGSEVEGHLIRCFAEFIMGMAAFILYEWRMRCGRRPNDWEAGLLMVCAAASLVARIDLFAALLFPFVVAAVAVNDGKVARVLSGRVLYFLGLVSFSIYLIHDPIRRFEVQMVRSLLPDGTGPVAALALACAGSLSIVPVAWLAYIWVERPGRAMVRHWGMGWARRG